MPLTTGQYFSAILLAVTPTALGGAIGIVDGKANPTVADWTAALTQVGDTDAVNQAVLAILTGPEFQPIIDALRTPQPVKNADGSAVKFSDGTDVTVDAAGIIRDMVWNNGPWTGSPPHPKATNVLTLLTLLNSYVEV